MEEETLNLDKEEIRLKNKAIIEELDEYEFHKDKFIERSNLIKRFLSKIYDEKFDKLFNVVIILEYEFN